MYAPISSTISSILRMYLGSRVNLLKFYIHEMCWWHSISDRMWNKDDGVFYFTKYYILNAMKCNCKAHVAPLRRIDETKQCWFDTCTIKLGVFTALSHGSHCIPVRYMGKAQRSNGTHTVQHVENMNGRVRLGKMEQWNVENWWTKKFFVKAHSLWLYCSSLAFCLHLAHSFKSVYAIKDTCGANSSFAGLCICTKHIAIDWKSNVNRFEKKLSINGAIDWHHPHSVSNSNVLWNIAQPLYYYNILNICL